jgi:hypothetical protein
MVSDARNREAPAVHLMLNRLTTVKVQHGIGAALRRANKNLSFKIQLGRSAQKLFDHLAE